MDLSAADVLIVNMDTLKPGGRLFVCGDLHGSYELLLYYLKHAGFDFKKDLLVVPGDIIDRGLHSEELVGALDQSWLLASKGNHEDFLIKGIYSLSHRLLHQRNGGNWFYELPLEQQQQIAERLKELPYAIEVHYKGLKIGFTHADVRGDDWELFKQKLSRPGSQQRITRKYATLSRSRFSGSRESVPIQNIDALFVGHNVTLKPFRIHNTFYIDTGACMTNKLTLINIDNIRDIILSASTISH